MCFPQALAALSLPFAWCWEAEHRAASLNSCQLSTSPVSLEQKPSWRGCSWPASRPAPWCPASAVRPPRGRGSALSRGSGAVVPRGRGRGCGAAPAPWASKSPNALLGLRLGRAFWAQVPAQLPTGCPAAVPRPRGEEGETFKRRGQKFEIL